jgi:hypothetical protein
MSPIPSRNLPPAWAATFALALLGVFLFQTIASMRLFTATSDETTHLPSGYTYVATGGIRLNPQHPPLVKLLAGIAVAPLRPRLDLEQPAWRSEPPNEWEFGRNFLYSNDADRLLLFGRMPVVFLAVVLGIYVWRWARERFGEIAGVAATALFAFCPTLIAHAHWVTMDVPLAAFSTLALYELRAWLLRGGTGRLLRAGVGLGLALATKFSAIVLFAVETALLGLAASLPPRGCDAGEASPRLRSPLTVEEPAARARAAVAGWIVLAGTAFVVVWAAYLFPADPFFYWKGLLLVNKDHDPTYAAYLMGHFKVGGFWSYFPVAFLVKTPVPTLILLALGIGLGFRHGARAHSLEEILIYVPALAFFAATIAFAANIGVRYLIPVLPFVWILASRAAAFLFERGLLGRIGLVVLGLWLAIGTARIYPDHLAYFNEIAGGPSRGIEWLDDSNLDWGQDLKRLKAWMDENGVATVRLLYPWNGSPDYYGIRYEPVTKEDWFDAPRPGLYAVSAMGLVRGRLSARTEGAASDWLDRYRPVARVGYSFYIYRFD